MDMRSGAATTLERRSLQALNDLGQAVTSSLKLDDVLRSVQTQMTALVDAEWTAILLRDRDDLVYAAVTGPNAARLRGTRFSCSDGIAGRVVLTGQAQWLSTVSPNSELSTDEPSLLLDGVAGPGAAFPAGSMLVAPLRQREGVVGVLAVAHGSPRGLTADDLPTLEAAANWVAIAVTNARLHEQAQRARERQALLEERARLARELHDAVTQSLYSMVVLAGAWRRQIDDGQLTPQRDQIAELGDLAQQALREIRLLIYELRPTELAEEGLLGALYRRLETVEQRVGIDTHLLLTDGVGRSLLSPENGTDDHGAMIDFHRLPAPVEKALLRIAQEALNNVLRHSGATAVTIRIRLGEGLLSMVVQDNGCGFDMQQKRIGGFGLAGMEERATHLGGRLRVVTSPGQGTAIMIEGVPYRYADAEEMTA